MSKYIIKNCPCYNSERFLGGFLNDNDTFCAYYSKKCQDCTDCVTKQIVELLQQYDEEDSNWCEPISFNTENIYELLKIQEVE